MGDYLTSPVKEKEIEDNENPRLRFGACGMQGWRKQMEDSHICELNIGGEIAVFGVFDGHGGPEVALFVKRNYINILRNTPGFKKQDYATALRESFISVDEQLKTPDGQKELLEIARSSKSFSPTMGKLEGAEIANGTGCTACVALITTTEIYLANSGDSRAVLCKSKKALALSIDHKPTLPTEEARIKHAGGFVEDDRVKGILNLSRSLGDLEYKLDPKLHPEEQMITACPEIRKEKLTPDTEFLIIACDGIWDCLTNEKIVSIVQEKLKGSSKALKLSKLVADILDSILATDLDNPEGIGCDNMSCLLVQFKP